MTSQNVNNLHTAQKLAHVHQPGWFMTWEMRSDICECHCVEFIYQTKIKEEVSSPKLEFLEFHQIFLRCIQMGNVFCFFSCFIYSDLEVIRNSGAVTFLVEDTRTIEVWIWQIMYFSFNHIIYSRLHRHQCSSLQLWHPNLNITFTSCMGWSWIALVSGVLLWHLGF